MRELATINAEQELYVLNAGRGYSCLGFAYARRRAGDVARWAHLPLPVEKPGTVRAFAEYQRIMRDGAAYAERTGTRCEAELSPQLKGLEGWRVEVEDCDGEVRHFIVGKSTGWLPCHLEIKRRTSIDGMAAMGAPYRSVRKIERVRG